MSYYKAGLTDTVTFYNSVKSQNSIGQQKETETLIYSEIPCRLGERQRVPTVVKNAGAEQNFVAQYTLQVEPKYAAVQRGDIAVINGSRFRVTEQRQLKGMTSSAQLILYYIEKITDEA